MTSFRFALPTDVPFIRSGWSSSFRMSRDICLVQMSDYARVMHQAIDAILAKPNTKTIVAHGELALFGFICVEPPSYVYYVYIAQPYRHQGLARDLFFAAHIDPNAPFTYACRTKASWELRSKTPMAKFDPYRARFAQTEQPIMREET